MASLSLARALAIVEDFIQILGRQKRYQKRCDRLEEKLEF